MGSELEEAGANTQKQKYWKFNLHECILCSDQCASSKRYMNKPVFPSHASR